MAAVLPATGALRPAQELFILGETEEYFVSLTKQHFTGA